MVAFPRVKFPFLHFHPPSSPLVILKLPLVTLWWQQGYSSTSVLLLESLIAINDSLLDDPWIPHSQTCLKPSWSPSKSFSCSVFVSHAVVHLLPSPGNTQDTFTFSRASSQSLSPCGSACLIVCQFHALPSISVAIVLVQALIISYPNPCNKSLTDCSLLHFDSSSM
jgi:hypothetical protein